MEKMKQFKRASFRSPKHESRQNSDERVSAGRHSISKTFGSELKPWPADSCQVKRRVSKAFYLY